MKDFDIELIKIEKEIEYLSAQNKKFGAEIKESTAMLNNSNFQIDRLEEERKMLLNLISLCDNYEKTKGNNYTFLSCSLGLLFGCTLTTIFGIGGIFGVYAGLVLIPAIFGKDCLSDNAKGFSSRQRNGNTKRKRRMYRLK